MPDNTRDQAVVKLLGYGGSIWAVLFAVGVVMIGPMLTSQQWQYLLSFPGGEFSWGAIFAAGGIAGFFGLLKQKWDIAAAGCGMWGGGSALITIFYFLSPWVGPHILTLGWMPWLFPAVCGFCCVGVYWSDKTW